MAEIGRRPLPPLPHGGPFQPLHVGEFPAIVKRDRLERLCEKVRAESPFDLVHCLYYAVRGPVLDSGNNFPSGQTLCQYKQGFRWVLVRQ